MKPNQKADRSRSAQSKFPGDVLTEGQQQMWHLGQKKRHRDAGIGTGAGINIGIDR